MGRFCLFSSIFQLPFYTLVFSEWGCFFLLVRLGSGGNTKDFLSLSKKAPPQLSGLLACRYGRRRGLRNSLRSDSPRPFSSVFLATSPPDKGGDFAHAFAGLFNPSVLADTSPIFCATKHRGGGGDVFRFCPCSDFMSHTPQCCGARQGRSLEVALYSFFFELEYFS